MSDNYDDATLRLCYVKALISTISLFMSEAESIPHRPSIIGDALAGIEMMVDDAYKLLAKS